MEAHGTHDERLVVLLNLLDTPTVGRIIAHCEAERPFVDDLPTRKQSARGEVLVLLIQGGNDVGFKDKPTAKVDTANLVRRVVPWLAERRSEDLCTSAVVVRIRGIVDPFVCQSRHRQSQRMRTIR